MEDKNPELGRNSIIELLKAVDEWIPTPVRDLDKPLLLPIEDVFSISGRGTVVTGRIERGVVKKGQDVEIVGQRAQMKTVVTGLEMFHKMLDQGQAGDQLGALVRGIKKEDIRRGMVLCQPGSVKSHTVFKAQVYILKKEEGGRHTPFITNYSPQLYTRTADVTSSIELPSGKDMVMPGDDTELTITLKSDIPLEAGQRFTLREGSKTVGTGVITSILQ
jgi:elongation factor Tu